MGKYDCRAAYVFCANPACGNNKNLLKTDVCSGPNYVLLLTTIRCLHAECDDYRVGQANPVRENEVLHAASMTLIERGGGNTPVVGPCTEVPGVLNY